MEKCFICGRNVNIEKGNCIKTEAGYRHKKCPSEQKLKGIERDQWKSLVNTINEQYISRPSDYYKEHSLNWKAITNQIRKLRSDGYTYEEIEYATKEVYKEFGLFFGFGGVVNRIVGIIAKRNKKVEMMKNITTTKSTESNPIDLSNIINESEEW